MIMKKDEVRVHLSCVKCFTRPPERLSPILDSAFIGTPRSVNFGQKSTQGIKNGRISQWYSKMV